MTKRGKTLSILLYDKEFHFPKMPLLYNYSELLAIVFLHLKGSNIIKKSLRDSNSLRDILKFVELLVWKRVDDVRLQKLEIFRELRDRLP